MLAKQMVFLDKCATCSTRTSNSTVFQQKHVFIRQYYQGQFSLIRLGELKYIFSATATAKSLQSCLTLCDPIDGSPPNSPVPGVLQARTLEWVAISFCSAWKWKVKVMSLSHVTFLATPWTATYQAPPPMGFSRQKYGSGLTLPSLGMPSL